MSPGLKQKVRRRLIESAANVWPWPLTELIRHYGIKKNGGYHAVLECRRCLRYGECADFIFDTVSNRTFVVDQPSMWVHVHGGKFTCPRCWCRWLAHAQRKEESMRMCAK